MIGNSEIIIFILCVWLCVMTGIYRHKWFLYFKNGKQKTVLFDLIIWDKRLKGKERVRKCIKMLFLGLFSLLPEIAVAILIPILFGASKIAVIFAYIVFVLFFIFEYATTCVDAKQEGTYVRQTEKRSICVWLIVLLVITVITAIFGGIFIAISESWVDVKREESESIYNVVSWEGENYYDASSEEKELFKITYVDENGVEVTIRVSEELVSVATSHDVDYLAIKETDKYVKKMVYHDSEYEYAGKETEYVLYLIGKSN